MPIYEYICQGCLREFELLVSAGTTATSCPHCGCRKLTRKFSTFPAHSDSSPSAGEGLEATPACGAACALIHSIIPTSPGFPA
ncbi:MAG: zinc ribbon domain-containing protein [Phycisphaerae bacterium]|nr:zinc ribbon domain-containing protein [Phycisphaerae bacterium]